MKKHFTITVYKYLSPHSFNMMENYHSLPELAGLYYYSKKDAVNNKDKHPADQTLTKMKLVVDVQ